MKTFSFKILYKNKDNVCELQATLFADTVETARMKLERRFKATFPVCELIHIGQVSQ